MFRQFSPGYGNKRRLYSIFIVSSQINTSHEAGPKKYGRDGRENGLGRNNQAQPVTSLLLPFWKVALSRSLLGWVHLQKTTVHLLLIPVADLWLGMVKVHVAVSSSVAGSSSMAGSSSVAASLLFLKELEITVLFSERLTACRTFVHVGAAVHLLRLLFVILLLLGLFCSGTVVLFGEFFLYDIHPHD